MPSRYITFISYDGLLAVTYNAPSSRRTDKNLPTSSSWTDVGGTQRWVLPSRGQTAESTLLELIMAALAADFVPKCTASFPILPTELTACTLASY